MTRHGLVGRVLVAPPLETDINRLESVILVTNEYNGYYIGVRLNNPSKMTMRELAAYLGHKDSNADNDIVHVGGVYSLNSFSLLHSNDWEVSSTIKINHFMSISSSTEVLDKFLSGDKPRYYKMFLGIYKWAPNQLESEIIGIPPYSHELSWCVTSSSMELIFNTPSVVMWDTAITNCGHEFSRDVL